MRGLIRLVALAPLVLLAACGGASSSPTTASTSTSTTTTTALRAVGPASAHDLSAVRRAAAHTLTLRAAASLQFLSLPSVHYPALHATGTFDLRGATGKELVHDSFGTEMLLFGPQRVFDRRPPAEAGGQPHGKPWIRADFDDEKASGPPSIALFFLSAVQRDPGFLLAEVAWGARAAAPLGSRTIAGHPADGYVVHVATASTAAAASASGPRAQSFVRTSALLGKALAAEKQIVYVWVDRSGRIVALRAATVGSGGIQGTTLVTLSSFGVPVRLAPPAPSLTVGLDKLIKDGD